jgi:hypothetical protein
VSTVDLPAPFGPTRAMIPPAGMSIETGPISTSLL